MSVELVNSHVLFPHVANYDTPIRWDRIWESGIVDSEFGKESRFALRSVPLLGLSWDITARNLQDDARLLDRIMAARKSGLGCVPAFGRGIELASAASGTAVVIAPTFWPLAVNDWMIFLGDGGAYDVRQIGAVAGVNVTLATALSRMYYAGTLCWPLVFGKFDCDGLEALVSDSGSASASLRQMTSNRAATVGTAGTPINGIGGWIINGNFVIPA